MFLGLCGDVVGSGCAGEVWLKMRSVVLGCVLVGLVVLVRGLRPVPPVFGRWVRFVCGVGTGGCRPAPQA